MTKQPTTKTPEINLASEPWVMEQVMNTENRIEKAFHDQTKYLDEKQNRFEIALKEQARHLDERQVRFEDKLDTNMRWMIGLMITMIITVVVAIFIEPSI